MSVPSFPAHGTGSASPSFLLGTMIPSEYVALVRCPASARSCIPDPHLHSLPCDALLPRLGRHRQVRDVTDACQRLAAEAVRAQRGQIRVGLDLGRREPLAEDGEISFLLARRQLRARRAVDARTRIPEPLSWI